MTQLASTLHAELERAGYEPTIFDLTTTRLAFCQGEFDCWMKTPGQCRAHDAEADIVAAVHDADALVLVEPVTFGGHGHVIKRAIDRLLCLLEPFFVQRASLTHHAARYDKHPRLFAVGWAADASPDEVTTYGELNDAFAINYFAPACGALVLDDTTRASWGAAIGEMLAHPRAPGEGITGRDALRQALVAAATPDASGGVAAPIERVALLVGSPKIKGTSASEAMARALARRFTAAQVPSEIHFATEFVHDDAHAAERAAKIARCDLFFLVTPLYVDAFPALTTHALELVARARAEAAEPARFVTLVNCGFPEPEQNRTALRIARHFAARARYTWAGGLPLGGGGMVQPDAALDEAHGPTAGVVRALDLSVAALVAGAPVPEAAIAAITAAMMPALARAMVNLLWRWQAHKNGLAQRDLHARPLDAEER